MVPDSIVCLVGENPLPIYLGIRQFGELGCKIILVHSGDTRKHADRIQTQLQDDGYNHVSIMLLELPYDARAVTTLITAVHEANPNAWLNYTGGTKVMSAFAVKAWNNDHTAFYLDDSASMFRFANGRDVELKAVNLRVRTLFNLHAGNKKKFSLGYEPKEATLETLKLMYRTWNERNDRNWGGRSPFMEDEWEGFGDAAAQVATARVRWELFKDTFGIFSKIPAPADKDKYEGRVDKSKRDDDYVEYDNNVEYYKIATTAWFELLVQSFCREAPDGEFEYDAKFYIDSNPFQVDVLGIKSNRLYYFSCTTSAVKDRIKGKAFEAVYRAHQIAGSMARVGVVCLAPDNDLTKIRGSLKGVPRLRVFGKTDVDQWIAGNLGSLKNFLEK